MVKPVSLVPRNPADSWGIAESDDKEAETKSETAWHAAPVQKAAADNLADRCRLRKQQTVSQIRAGSTIRPPKLPGTLRQLTIQEEVLWNAPKACPIPKLPNELG